MYSQFMMHGQKNIESSVRYSERKINPTDKLLVRTFMLPTIKERSAM